MPPFIFLAILACSIKAVDAASFVAPQNSLWRRSDYILTNRFAEKLVEGDDDADKTPASSAIDENRRKFLSLAPASTLPFLLNSGVASASTSVSPTNNEAYQVNTAISMRAPSRVLLDTEEERRIAIFERVAPSVVYIDTFAEKRDVFSTNVLEVPVGSGSGYVWDDSGHIITNFHVVQSAQSAQIAILTAGGNKPSIKPEYTSVRPGALGEGSTVLKDFTRKTYKAKVVGVDPTKDIAVLKVDDVPISELRPIEVGTSTGLRVGQGALAIGNPFGLDHTLT